MSKRKPRVALVTGGNKGIGLEICRRLADLNITVVMGARNADRGRHACSGLQEQGLDVHFQLLDVADPDSITAAMASIRTTFGRLHILVNNAGIMIDNPEKDLTGLDPTALMQTLMTNAIGPCLLCRSCLVLMREEGFGRIVNMASTLGSLTDITDPDSAYSGLRVPAYRMSKALLNAVTAVFAAETRGSNILVNSACPGWVRTDMGGKQAPLSIEEGADTPVWLATLPEGGPSGGFFRERRRIPW
jgi:NAD(P)-dependent dehydrogenase (short-subunit alcohol dehydrogenase family)